MKQLTEKGVAVFYVRDDVEERGIPTDSLISEAEAVSRTQLAKFIDQYDQIWHW